MSPRGRSLHLVVKCGKPPLHPRWVLSSASPEIGKLSLSNSRSQFERECQAGRAVGSRMGRLPGLSPAAPGGQRSAHRWGQHRPTAADTPAPGGGRAALGPRAWGAGGSYSELRASPGGPEAWSAGKPLSRDLKLEKRQRSGAFYFTDDLKDQPNGHERKTFRTP